MSQNDPIRAIVGRFSFDFSRQALEHALEKRPFEFLANISADRSPGERFPPFAHVPTSQQEHFSSGEIRNCHYANAKWNSIAPLDEEIILRMSECESVFMALVSRLERKRSITYLTRKLWYLRHLQFWNDYLTRHKINLYLSAWIPHEIPDIIIYHLCKLQGIPTLYFNTTELRDVSFAERDIRESAHQILPCYEQLLSRNTDHRSDSVKLGEPFASYEQALLPKLGTPPEIEKISMQTYWEQLGTLLWSQPRTFMRFAFRYCTPAGWQHLWRTVQRSLAIHRHERFYLNHAIEPDLTCPYVYFPLHFQPEATTLPMGGVFADLILAARLLNEALPKDVLIYVKEHPNRSNWANRSIEYYKDFLALEKVRFVPATTGTFTLREHCRAVATITGSAGFEALFREKPVFLFGSRYYQFAKGVFPIRSRKECADAVRAIFERGEKPTKWSTHLFLKAMETTCVLGVLDPWSLQISKLPQEEHVCTMGTAILKGIGEVCANKESA